MNRLTDYLGARESLHPAFAEAVERLARADCDEELTAYRARLRERVATVSLRYAEGETITTSDLRDGYEPLIRAYWQAVADVRRIATFIDEGGSDDPRD